MREPDEINIENIKKRIKSDPLTHEQTKERIRIENKLKKDSYSKDEWVKNEIEKTMKELYGDNNKK